MIKRILFVCTGNTCRSPMAAALLRDAVGKDPELGAACLEVWSAGISATDGEPATQLATEAIKPYGVDLKGHRATRLTPDLVNWADLILTIAQGHTDHIVGRVPEAALKTFTLGEYVGAASGIGDPLVAGTEEAYGRCLDQIAACIPSVVNWLRFGAIMGHYDSSRTRVVPIFTRLHCMDLTGRTWLQGLVDLPTRSGRVRATVGSSPLREALWWPNEMRLAPPTSLLAWLLENVKGPTTNNAGGEGVVRTKREALVQGDRAVIAEALARLEVGLGERDWAVLEGPSQPDVFLATNEVLVVIEGKRTESGPTTATTWMRVRHQMLRHLDAAWEIRRGRLVYGFFIVEGNPDHNHRAARRGWQEAAEATVSADALDGSLPHRTPEERRQIAEAFLGVTTWSAVCACFDIPLAVLIDKVV